MNNQIRKSSTSGVSSRLKTHFSPELKSIKNVFSPLNQHKIMKDIHYRGSRCQSSDYSIDSKTYTIRIVDNSESIQPCSPKIICANLWKKNANCRSKEYGTLRKPEAHKTFDRMFPFQIHSRNTQNNFMTISNRNTMKPQNLNIFFPQSKWVLYF